jgi:hypothetical protein
MLITVAVTVTGVSPGSAARLMVWLAVGMGVLHSVVGEESAKGGATAVGSVRPGGDQPGVRRRAVVVLAP